MKTKTKTMSGGEVCAMLGISSAGLSWAIHHGLITPCAIKTNPQRSRYRFTASEVARYAAGKRSPNKAKVERLAQ